MRRILIALMVLVHCRVAMAQMSSSTPPATPAPSQAIDRSTLDRRKPLPSREELREKLKSIAKESSDQTAAKDLVAQLGHDDFAVREKASQTLKERPWLLYAWQQTQKRPSKTQLISQTPAGTTSIPANVSVTSEGLVSSLPWLPSAQQAVEEDAVLAALSPEVRWRMQKLLPSGRTVMEHELLSVVDAIRQQHLQGLAQELVDCSPAISSSKQLLALGEAVQETATPSDRPLMLVSSKTPNLPIRYLSLLALGTIGTPEDLSLVIVPASQEADEWVKLAGSRAAIGLGHRPSLATLAKLLESESEDIRSEANSLLMAVTGKDFGFLATDAGAKRSQLAKQWQTWAVSSGATAGLQLPIIRLPRERGILLVSDVAGRRLIEMDVAGNLVWEKKLDFSPWACQGLPNGHRLVCSAESSIAVEFDEQGNEVWKSKPLPKGPMSVQRLASGNTLIACSWSDLVIEVGTDGEPIWRVAVEGRPVDAQRLENGNTLVTLQNEGKVVEIDSAGKVVNEEGNLGFSFGVSRLRNGNFLSCDFRTSTVKETAPGGKLLWSHQGFVSPILAQRLRNGNTLVSDRRGVKEISPDGQEVRSWNVADVFRYCWY
ncbi:MAG: PQQ-binding-like beta-propeller repeat protein [Planctomycetaceae bacterium]